MSWYRWLACASMLGVVDAAWLYLVLGVLGFVAGIGHSPLALLVAIAVLIIGLLTRAVYDLMPVKWRQRAIFRPAIACLVAWLAIGSTSTSQTMTPGLLWPVRVLSGDAGSRLLIAIALAATIVAALWRQGERRGLGGAGTVAFARSFRAGLVTFVVVLCLEAAGDLDLGTRLAMGPFFVATLFGMALARAPAHGAKLYLWLALLGACIVLILLSALVLTVFAMALLRGGFCALRDAWLEFALAVDRSVSDTLTQLLGTREVGDFSLHTTSAEPSQALMLAVLLLGAMIFAPLAYRLLNAPPTPALPPISLDLGSPEHDSIDEHDSEVVGQLLERLLPRWAWRRRSTTRSRKLPGHPQLAQAYNLYFLLLDRAGARGLVLNPAHTPRERMASLLAGLPELPVERLTAIFEAACYGGELASQQELDRLSAQCKRPAKLT